jgi:hypothetical protein
MRMIERRGAIQIWEVTEPWGLEYYVYGILADPIVCPSLDMARAKAAF